MTLAIDDKVTECGRTVLRIWLGCTLDILNVAELSTELCIGMFYSSKPVYSVT